MNLRRIDVEFIVGALLALMGLTFISFVIMVVFRYVWLGVGDYGTTERATVALMVAFFIVPPAVYCLSESDVCKRR